MNYGEGNQGGNEIIVATDPNIAPMEGIFVIAEAEGETVTFTPANRTANDEERIIVNLSGPSTSSGAAVVDRAIVRFGEGRTLPKFQIRDNSTRIYIPQGGKDYAIATVGRDVARNVFIDGDVARYVSTKEIPVNFKAEKNGTYTLSVSVENVEMEYLHLIDNMTGEDVDLLTPAGSSPSERGPGGVNQPRQANYRPTTLRVSNWCFPLMLQAGTLANPVLRITPMAKSALLQTHAVRPYKSWT